MDEVLHSFLYAFSTFLPVVNPFGGALFFLSLTAGISDPIRHKITNKMAVYTLIIVLVSVFAGRLILSFFGISLPVLKVAGGIVLFFAGWEALNAKSHTTKTDKHGLNQKSEEELLAMAFYPITLPLLAGPGTISVAAAIGSSQADSVAKVIGIILATLALTAVTWICLRFSDKIPKAIGKTGAEALVRLFSFILVCIGISLVWDGLSALLSSLPR